MNNNNNRTHNTKNWKYCKSVWVKLQIAEAKLKDKKMRKTYED